jgi:phosphoglucosamine mutase
VKEKHLDVGFAFDGDADRCIAVDENGNVANGDTILYILAKRFQERGMLENNTVVATVMSNSGLSASLWSDGIFCIQTTVGDRFVYECMLANGYALGGEQSGHIIMKKYATTGDGILTALMLTEELCDKKATLSSLSASITLYPQYVENLRVTDKEAVISDAFIHKKAKEIETKICGKGRVLLRKSGTESVIRIMIECENEEQCKKYAFEIASAIRERGYCHE